MKTKYEINIEKKLLLKALRENKEGISGRDIEKKYNIDFRNVEKYATEYLMTGEKPIINIYGKYILLDLRKNKDQELLKEKKQRLLKNTYKIYAKLNAMNNFVEDERYRTSTFLRELQKIDEELK